MSEKQILEQKKEDEGAQIKIFDYILEMENRIDQILTHTEEKAQQQLQQREQRLEADFELKVKELTSKLEERKRVVQDKITGDKKLYDQLIADKIQGFRAKFEKHKATICNRILQELNLPFVKVSPQKKTKRTKK